jgi:hypothetical protein
MAILQSKEKRASDCATSLATARHGYHKIRIRPNESGRSMLSNLERVPGSGTPVHRRPAAAAAVLKALLATAP